MFRDHNSAEAKMPKPEELITGWEKWQDMRIQETSMPCSACDRLQDLRPVPSLSGPQVSLL